MGFLPGSGVPLTKMALVTEKGGQIVAGRCRQRPQAGGRRRARGAWSRGRAGFGDVVADPDFAGNQRVYLSFAEAGAGRDQRRGARLWHA